MAECAAGPNLTIAQLHALLQAELDAGHGENLVLVEGPLTLFEVNGVRVEPAAGRVWLETSWCHTQQKLDAG